MHVIDSIFRLHELPKSLSNENEWFIEIHRLSQRPSGTFNAVDYFRSSIFWYVRRSSNKFNIGYWKMAGKYFLVNADDIPFSSWHFLFDGRLACHVDFHESFWRVSKLRLNLQNENNKLFQKRIQCLQALLPSIPTLHSGSSLSSSVFHIICTLSWIRTSLRSNSWRLAAKLLQVLVVDDSSRRNLHECQSTLLELDLVFVYWLSIVCAIAASRLSSLEMAMEVFRCLPIHRFAESSLHLCDFTDQWISSVRWTFVSSSIF